jgi:hypothetical protein
MDSIIDAANSAKNDALEVLYNQQLVDRKYKLILTAMEDYMKTIAFIFDEYKSATDAETVRDIEHANKLINTFHNFLMSTENILSMNKKSLTIFCTKLSFNDFFDELQKSKPGYYLLGSDIKTDQCHNLSMYDSVKNLTDARLTLDIVLPATLDQFTANVNTFYSREVKPRYHEKLVSDKLLIKFFEIVETNLNVLYIEYILKDYAGVASKFKELCESNEQVKQIILDRARPKKNKSKSVKQYTEGGRIKAIVPEIRSVARIMLQKVHREGHSISALQTAIDAALKIVESIEI